MAQSRVVSAKPTKTRQRTKNARSINVFLHRMLCDPNFALGSKLRNSSRPAIETNIGMAQWLPCWAHNPKVRGSKPRSANWSAMIACNPLFLASNLHFYELRATFPDCPGCVRFKPRRTSLASPCYGREIPRSGVLPRTQAIFRFPQASRRAPTAGKVEGASRACPYLGFTQI
jgi:hypothetical protein